MYDVILFGGTTEGRLLGEELCRLFLPSLICTATEYGGELVNITSSAAKLRMGRISESEMRSLFTCHQPKLIIDATHPYATQVTKNLRAACEALELRYLRIVRECLSSDGCYQCETMPELISLLNSKPGKIFSTLGAKEAPALTAVEDYKKRIILRILPQPFVLDKCLKLGYSPANIICMQGPFSEKINLAMFIETGAALLVTKESGEQGGFEEKLSAARACDMDVLVLRRPPEADGISLNEAIAKLGELVK